MRLHVNVDHVATLRQARGGTSPDPVWAAAQCEIAGADGITVHLREDRRHIQDRDLRVLRETVHTFLNLEMACTDEMIAIARELRPDLVTLVPERREERTTEGGLAVAGQPAVERTVRALAEARIDVSLFVDPDRPVMQAARDAGARCVELHTGHYCNARGAQAEKEIERLAAAAQEAVALGLRVAAGHGLDYANVRPVVGVPGIEELNIGHAIVARALFVGLPDAVREMCRLIA